MKRFWWTASSLTLAVVAAISVASLQGEPARAQQGAGSPGVKAQRCLIVLKDFATLAADRPGTLAFVEAEDGDPVREGEIVAGMMDEEIQAKLDTQNIQAGNDISVQYAEAAAKVADAEFKMAVEANLKVPDAVSKSEINKLQLEVEKFGLSTDNAKLELEVVKSQVKETLATLNTFKVKAPFDGYVAKVHRSAGEAVRQGDPIVEIISTERVNVEGFVTIAESYQIKRGDLVRVRMNVADLNLPQFRDTLFEGAVTFVDPRVSNLTGFVKVHALVKNDGGILKPGLPAEMTIIPRPAKQTARSTR